MENNDKKMWGLESDTYDKLASSHSRANIFLWIVGGLIYNFFNGDLISLSSVLVVFPGIFIASFASIPTFWVNVKKMQILQKTNNILVLIGFTIWYAVDLIFPILMSILFIKFISLFN